MFPPATVLIKHLFHWQVNAEKTKSEALAQEKEAAKLKQDNQIIKDEAEADLST